MKFSSTYIRVAAAAFALSLGSQGAFGQIAKDRLSGIVAQLKGEDFKGRYEARMVLQDEVSKASVPGNEADARAVERQILSLLNEGDLPVGGTLWVLRQLHTIGSGDSVDTLESLLSSEHPQVADAARMALQMNTSPESVKALLRALDTKKADRRGIVDSIAQKGSAEALKGLVALLPDEDLEFSKAALLAVSQFDDSEKALKKLRETLPSSLGEAVELALVNVTRDWKLCSELANRGASDSVKTAAALRCLELNSRKGGRLIGELLKKSPSAVSVELIHMAILDGNSASQKAVLKASNKLDDAQKAALVAALGAGKRSSDAEKAVLKVADTEHEPLKLQAIVALGKIGSRASLPLLLDALESRSREITEEAERSLGSLKDAAVDEELLAAASKGKEAKRINAIAALGYRNSEGGTALLNEIAVNDKSEEAREAAVDALEIVGDATSFETLIALIVSEPAKGGLRRDAQSVIKRMSLRIGDSATAWTAFEQGLFDAKENREAYDALLAVIDSAPTKEAIDYLRRSWKTGDEELRKTILRVLPVWRNWDGGHLLLEIAKDESTSSSDVSACYKGIGRLILGGGDRDSIDGKFDLAEAALKDNRSAENRRAILAAFKKSGRQEQNYARRQDSMDPELKAAVLGE